MRAGDSSTPQPSVLTNVPQSIKVADGPGVLRSAQANTTEPVHVNDTLFVAPPVKAGEAVHVLDGPTALLSILAGGGEAVQVSDSAGVVLSLMVTVNEGVAVGDGVSVSLGLVPRG